jgi:dTDP-4-amino-4,6-dideoxygalactose transaminase
LEGTEGLTLPPFPNDRRHLYTHFAILVKERESFIRRMIRRGVDAQRDYCSFCPKLPGFLPETANRQTPPAVSAASSLEGQVAYLPNQPSLGKPDMQRIAKNTKDALREIHHGR